MLEYAPAQLLLPAVESYIDNFVTLVTHVLTLKKMLTQSGVMSAAQSSYRSSTSGNNRAKSCLDIFYF